MGLAGSALDLIRTVARRENVLPSPSVYFDDLTRTLTNYGGSAIGPQSDFNKYLAGNVQLDQDLMSRYADYEDMDQYPEISAALDLLADDATTQDVISGRSMWYEAEDADIEMILNDMLNINLRAEEDLWEICRSMCKMGNNFEEIIVLDKLGVMKLNNLAAPTIRRIEDKSGVLYGFVQDPTMAFRIDTNSFLEKLSQKSVTKPTFGDTDTPTQMPGADIQVYEPWEVVHFRLRGKSRKELYGTSIMESARWVWKRLSMIEDAAILYKLTRSAQRYAFYVDVGDVPPNQARAHLNKVKNEFKKTRYVDPATGKMSFRYNPLCLSLDTRIPLLNGKVKSLKELIADHEAGVKNWTYSVDRETKQVVPGEIEWAGVTRKNADLVRVTFDNCKTETVTPDHKFLLRNGEYRDAKDLKVGDSLMPFNRGISHRTGYEYVVHPMDAGWEALEQTHRLVARNVFGDIHDLQAHHIDEDKRNNDPNNLQMLTCADHSRLHGRFAAWNQTEEHGRVVSETNRKYNKGLNIVAYNNSDQHVKDNDIRRAVKSQKWIENRDQYQDAMRMKFPEELKTWLFEIIRNEPGIGVDAICSLWQQNQGGAYDLLQKNNTRKVVSIKRHILLKAIRSFGFADYREFRQNVLFNHKVVSVEFINQKEDTGCITVSKWHNFALDSGVFVKNSQDEDFFVAVRKGKRTSEIELLSGPEGQQMDDINYFRDKLFTALKFPKSYLNMDETIGRANLSQQDVRCARTVMRIQRELKNGFHHIARIDLAAKNIDPDMVKFHCKMVVPSGVLELAQLEVQTTKLDLAQKYRDAQFSEYWVWSNILDMADDEVTKIRTQRAAERGEPSDPQTIQQSIDREKSQDSSKLRGYINEIKDEISEGTTDLAKRVKELKLLMNEVRFSLRGKDSLKRRDK